MEKIQITNIELSVGKNKSYLNPKEACELKDILNEAFPEKEIVPFPTHYPHYAAGTLTLSIRR